MVRSDHFGVAIVDRMESDVAVLDFFEPKFSMEIPRELLPDEAREGTALELKLDPRPEIERRWREQMSEQQEELL